MADQLDDAENLIDKAAVAAEMGVLAVIMKRLGAIGRGTDPAELAGLEVSDFMAIEAALEKGRALIGNAVLKAVQGMDRANREWASAYYEASGASESAEASAMLIEGRREIAGAAQDMLRTSALGVLDESGNLVSLRNGYRSSVSRAVAAMTAGKESYQTAIARAAAEFSRGGLRVLYESGATRELYAAVRTNVMDGYKTLMTAQRRAHSEAFGADAAEVSAHWPCAPDHQTYQGRRYPMREWEALEASLPRPLVTGANCRHTVSFVIMAVGKPPYSNSELDRMIRESNETVMFRGIGGKKQLEMTRYDATQYQRGIEREIRRSKTEGYLMEQAGQSGAASVARADAYADYYRSFCDRLGLSPREERTRLYTSAG